MDEWEVRVTDEFLTWAGGLDPRSKALVVDAIDRLADAGPSLGRPLVDRFVFDPWRSAILLVGGDKSGNWSGWYRTAIPQAETLYVEYVKEREAEEGSS
ncbi:addiction module toxin RelE [Parafrankia sp. FMc2]|uniref:addiction module toxin RelE n=1 Tax=Parafrankia sp. FMc2 TaxID=3233196 RepID=UPI0034D53926